MSTATKSRSMPIIAIDMPVMFEDEGYEEMGESLPHSTSEAIIRFGLMERLRISPGLQIRWARTPSQPVKKMVCGLMTLPGSVGAPSSR